MNAMRLLLFSKCCKKWYQHDWQTKILTTTGFHPVVVKLVQQTLIQRNSSNKPGVFMTDKPVIAGPPYWGVDCVAQADKPFGGASTLYEYVLKCSDGRPPAFFGRYLTPNKDQRITSNEREFLRERNCRLLLNYNQFRHATVTLGRDSGKDHAKRAANLATAIGAPLIKLAPIIYIYANIDAGMRPTVDWIVGWWDGLWELGYAPGLYYPAEGSKKIGQAMELCMIPDPRTWVSVWSWSGQSQGSKNTGAKQFAPAQPIGQPQAIDIWQYATQCFPYKGDIKKSFDMNLASEMGYTIMWKC